jgi:hypothetical protein
MTFEHYPNLVRRQQLIISEAFNPTEEPEMTYEEAMMIARYGRTFGAFATPARKALRNEAIELLKKRAEELMVEADKKAAPAYTLVDVQIYGDAFERNADKRWVKRVFSDGSTTRALELCEFAVQLKYTFDAGKKAGKRAAYDDKDVS